MKKVALKKLIEIKSGYSPSSFNLMESGPIPYVKVEDMNNCNKYQYESREYCGDYVRSIPAGSVIFPKRGAAIMSIKIPVPPLEEQEQKQIAETLSSAQQEIDLLKQLAEKYKTQKRGLMQKLLTGDWRIKPEILNKYKEA